MKFHDKVADILKVTRLAGKKGVSYSDVRYGRLVWKDACEALEQMGYARRIQVAGRPTLVALPPPPNKPETPHWSYIKAWLDERDSEPSKSVR